MEKIFLGWTSFKTRILDKALVRFIERDEFYKIYIGDFETSIAKDAGAEQIDFEANYKVASNKSTIETVLVASSPAFGAKSFIVNGVVKSLFARFTGIQYAITTGANVLEYTATFPWVKIIGLEVVNCEALDTVSLKVYDTAAGTYSGVPNYMLNQFSFSLNLAKDYYIKMSQFDADLYQGMLIKFDYNSISAKTIGVNLLINEVK